MEQSFHVPGICRSCNLRIPAVVIVPFLYGVYLTFTSWDGVSSNKPFVGLKNYAAVVADSSFWQSLGLTLLYCGSFRNTGKRDRIFTGTAGNRKN